MATLTTAISIAPSYSGTWSKQQHMQSIGLNRWSNPKNYELWGWGINPYGSLGQNDTIDRSSPVQIGSDDWAAIAGGLWFILATKIDNTLWAWGYNSYGALGDNTAASKSSPVQVSALTNWLSISAGKYHSLAIKNDGTLWTWGRNNNYGQLGDGTVINRFSPVQIGTSLDKWVFVTASEDFTIAIKGSNNARTLWTWGNNQYGQLGSNTVVNRSSPVQLGGYNLIYDIAWASASAGRSHVLAVKTDGTLWSWGRNQAGQLGLSDTIYRSSPVQIGSLSNWSITSSGVYHCMAIKTDGTLWAWGLNGNGQLGINNQNNRSSPVQIGALTNWLSICTGYSSSVALKTDGTIWAWGYNIGGQLGDNTVLDKSSPVQVGTKPNWKSLPSSGGTNNTAYALTIPAGASTWTAPSQANYLWTWGSNNYGQLGLNLTGTASYRSSPTQIGLTQFLSVSGSYQSLSGIRPNGTIWTWGRNDYGQAGQNSLVNTTISSPVQVGALTDWAVSNTGLGHTLALKTNGTLWAWGYNIGGQLGKNDVISRSSPVQVGNLTTWSKIYVGSYHSVAIKTDNTFWTWGLNGNGQLGLGNVVYRLSPVQIDLSTNWASASLGTYNTIAVKTDGTLWSWGRNIYGGLGLGNTVDRSSPVQIGALTNWLSVAANGYNTIAVKTNGTLWAWGYNIGGQLGDNTVLDKSSPVQVGALTNWSKPFAGGSHSISIKTDNTLWSWGNNGQGQLGDITGINKSSPIQIGASIDWSSSIITAGQNHSAAISKITIY